MESSVGGSAAIGVHSAVARQANAARLGATAANQLATSASGQVSFSSSWQSLLASLGTGGREPGETENAFQAAATSLGAADGGVSTTSASALARSLTSSLPTEQAKVLGQSAASSARAQASASQLTSAQTEQTAPKTEATKLAAGATTDASGATRAAHSSKKAPSDARQTAVVSAAVQDPQVAIALVPVTVNQLSAAAVVEPASLETAVSSCLATGSAQSFSSRSGSVDGIPDGKEALERFDHLPEEKATMTSGTASQSAATSVSSEGSDSASGLPDLASGGDSQAVRSTATASPAGNTNTSRGQTLSVSGPGGDPASNGSSGATVDGLGVSTGGGSALSVEGAAAQLPSSPGAFAGSSTAVQGQSQVPDAIPGQSANATASSMGSGNSNLLQVQAGNDTSQTNPYAAIPSITGKTAVAGRSRTSETETLRTVRESGKPGLTQQGIQVHGQQASTSSADAVTMVRDPSARGAVNTTGDAAKDNSSAASGLKETFAALDAEGATGKPTWVHAGAQRAEAGIQDPELGWVGVRADMGSGGVHASLVPGSADAAQALGGHLAGLNSYLSDHHTPVETLTLAAPESGWSGPGAGAGQSMGQGQADQQGQNAGGSAETGATSSLSSSPTSLTVAVSLTSPQDFEEMNGNTSTVQVEGTHISVLA
jgi:hypothetical protein